VTIKWEWIPIFLPPLNEQKEIASLLNVLFTKIDSCEVLKRSRVLLIQYRQSTLKDAFEGKLTEKRRRKNSEKVKQVELLLNIIRKESNEKSIL